MLLPCTDANAHGHVSELSHDCNMSTSLSAVSEPSSSWQYERVIRDPVPMDALAKLLPFALALLLVRKLRLLQQQAMQPVVKLVSLASSELRSLAAQTAATVRSQSQSHRYSRRSQIISMPTIL